MHPRLALLYVLVPLGLVVAGHLAVLQRAPDTLDPHLDVRGDSAFYRDMALGLGDGVPEPFRYRILVPALAALSGVEPLVAMRAITYASLFLCYGAWLLMARRLGVGLGPATAGVVVVAFARWQAYHYHNPFLTDALGLLVLTLMLWAALEGFFLLFAAAALVGVMGRETALVMLPAWLVRRDGWKALLLGVGCVAILWQIRLLVGPGPGVPDAQAGFDPLSMLEGAVLAWGPVWVLGALGFLLVPRAARATLCGGFVLVLPLAFAAAHVATDTGRMFGLLAPFLALFAALAFDALARRSALVFEAFLLLALVGLLVLTPTRALPVFWPEAILHGYAWRFTEAGLLLAFVASWRLRDELESGWRDMQAQLVAWARAWPGRLRRLLRPSATQIHEKA